MLVVCSLLFAHCCLWLAVRCSLFAVLMDVCCSLLFAELLFIAVSFCCRFIVACCLLFVVCCSVCVIWRLLLSGCLLLVYVVCNLVFSVCCCLPFVVRSLLLECFPCRVLFVVCCSLVGVCGCVDRVLFVVECCLLLVFGICNLSFVGYVLVACSILLIATGWLMSVACCLLFVVVAC